MVDGGTLDVSVVVPFFNPGANIEDCLASLRDQTLAAERYEVVLVDDGSTDGSEWRVQRYVDAAPGRFRMIRIPASGWPGRPRNVGVDEARGRYVQFVDSDDSLDPRALERLLDIGLSSDADIVIGKLTSDFRGLNHHVFRHTVTGRTLLDYPLVDTLTPHKMVRRELLRNHGIRFAEGPRHVEDEHFSMQIYTRARSVAVVGDLACYFYRRRRVAGRNLGDSEAVAVDYFRDLAAVLDVIEDNIADPNARIPVQRRFYRNEMLGRLRGPAMASYDESYRREVLDLVRALATSRFTPEVGDGLPFFLRAQSRLMLDGDLAGLTAYSRWLDGIRLAATTPSPTWTEGRLRIAIAAALHLGDQPLRLEREGSDWLLPETAAPGARHEDRLVTSGDLDGADLDCATISRADSQLWSTTQGLALSVTDDGEVEITGEVTIDPAALRGGRPLGAGLWDLRLRVGFGGLSFGSPLRPAYDASAPPAWLGPSSEGQQTVAPFWTSPSPALALDVDEWSHPLTDLIDNEVAPSLHGRDFRLDVSALRGAPLQRPAALILSTGEPGARPQPVEATLTVAAAGATVTATLPRRIEGDDFALWIRLGPPGGSPPRRLGWRLLRDGRQLTVSRSSGVHLPLAH
ncbi:MAG TPA: glycosyltransferase family A protein [Mycobacteriales bacterium]|nr:glycosyltransferase family A protein [Mycobacteriales bacterium]